MRVRARFRTASIVGMALAALALAISVYAGAGGLDGSSLRAAVSIDRIEVRLNAAVLAPDRQAQAGPWRDRREPTQSSGLLALVVAATLELALALAGAAAFYSPVALRYIPAGAGAPRAPPLLRLT